MCKTLAFQKLVSENLKTCGFLKPTFSQRPFNRLDIFVKTANSLKFTVWLLAPGSLT
jgi:hypothetical protein